MSVLRAIAPQLGELRQLQRPAIMVTLSLVPPKGLSV